MNIGMITCNYFMRIYNYQQPVDFNWGKMCEKYRTEFSRNDLKILAKEIRELGYDGIELWEPTFSHQVYTQEEAEVMARELADMGFKRIVYCIGGWGKHDMDHIEKAYKFAKALGSIVVTGCISKEDADIVLPEVDRCGKKYGLQYAIENHPQPSFEKPEDIAVTMMKYETVGANLDTGIYNMLGYDVLAAADLLKDRIYHVHLKDTNKGGDGCLPIGDGDAPIAGVLRKLREWNYKYLVSVEFEYPTDPAPGLKKSMEFIKSVLD